MKTKYIFITGGVYSSLGKGICSSSIGCLLSNMGYKVTMQKLDPYLNYDPRYLSPLQHGENFITIDGVPADLDLGNYERFTGQCMNKYSTVTSGKIYHELLERERRNDFNGCTVQVVPHVTDSVESKLNAIRESSKSDFVIVEIGGTVGDLESLSFIEAITRFSAHYGRENVMFIHVVPLITLNKVYGELKTKPAQHSVKLLRGMGINPDCVMLRTPVEVDQYTIAKLSSNINSSALFSIPDVDSIYELPKTLCDQNFDQFVINYFDLKLEFNFAKTKWASFIKKIKSNKKHNVTVGLVGEYVELHDSYISLIEALYFTGIELDTNISIKYIDAKKVNKDDLTNYLNECDCFVLTYGEQDKKVIDNYFEVFNLCVKLNKPLLAIDLGFYAIISNLYGKKTLFKHKSKKFEPMLGQYSLNNISDKIFKTKVINRRFILEDASPCCLYTNLTDDFEIILSSNSDLVCGCLYKNAKFIYLCKYRPEFDAKPFSIPEEFIHFISATINK